MRTFTDALHMNIFYSNRLVRIEVGQFFYKMSAISSIWLHLLNKTQNSIFFKPVKFYTLAAYVKTCKVSFHKQNFFIMLQMSIRISGKFYHSFLFTR